jgi:hypothetical protein
MGVKLNLLHIFYALRQISIKFGTGVCTKIYRVTASFIELGALASQTLFPFDA